MERAILTQGGFDKLVEELTFLKTKKRREVANQLEFARSLGDLRENAEYETAKEAKHQLEIRIAELEHKLGTAKIVDLSEVPEGRAFLGCKLDVKNLNTNKVMTYMLVAQDEADLATGKISVTSPIGKGLVGQDLNAIVEIQVPAGKLKLQIIKIEKQ